MRGKEYRAAIRPDDGVLALDTMFFADEILEPSEEFSSTPDMRPAQGKESDMAVSLVDSMSGTWNPEDFRDTYTDRWSSWLRISGWVARWSPSPSRSGPPTSST